MTMIRVLAGFVLCGCLAVTGQEPKKAAAPKEGSLEDLLQKALKVSPDIAVAEHKAALAQAQLAQVRAEVTAKLMTAKGDVDSAKAGLESAAKHFAIAQQLQKAANFSQVEFLSVEREMSAAKLSYEQKLVALKAMTESPVPVAALRRFPVTTRLDSARGLTWHLDPNNSVQEVRRTGGDPSQDENIRKALATQIADDKNHEQIGLRDEIMLLKELGDLKIIIRIVGGDAVPGETLAELKVSTSAGVLPLSAWLSMIQDVLPDEVEIYVKDYGIIITDKPLRNAVTLREFMRAMPAKAAETGPMPKTK